MSVAPDELERLAELDSSRSIGIQIGGPGFRTHQVRAFLAEGRTILELGEVSLRPGSILNGRVVDASGLGVEGARVTFGAPIEAEPGESRQARRGPRDLEARSWGGTAPALVTTSGPGGVFSYTVSDPDGYQDVNWVQAVLNASLNGPNPCYFHYYRASNALYLLNDAGVAWSGAQLGAGGTLMNSRCTVNLASLVKVFH